MKRDYKLRPIQEKDNTAVAALIRNNLKRHGLDIPGTAYFDPHIDRFYDFYAGRTGCGYYVLVDSTDQVVGGIGFDTIDPVNKVAELQKMYLDDSVKGNGLGYVLISFVEERMKEVGIRTSYLETHTNLQAAIHVYEKMGYQAIKRPEAVGHSTMDHFYIKELPKEP